MKMEHTAWLQSAPVLLVFTVQGGSFFALNVVSVTDVIV